MKLSDIILNEVQYNTYIGMVKVITTDISSTELAELVRALPGVTTVSMVRQEEGGQGAVLRVKLISQKPGSEAFQALKDNAVSKYQSINVFNVASKTIERK
jgi:hypothetical protein